jgi:hypothetical protein
VHACSPAIGMALAALAALLLLSPLPPVGANAATSAAAPSSSLSAPSCAAEPGKRASCYTQHWLSPPTLVPSGHSTDGPVIGNGDMGVVATGKAGLIQLYTGKNDFWSTRDVPSGGCAYALMGSGSLEISTQAAHPPHPPPPQPHPGKAMNCSLFNCTCQGFADYYGAIAGTGWGCAPQPAGKDWWAAHHCNAKTKGGFCDGPACKLAGHAPCEPPSPGPGPGPSAGAGVWNASQDLQAAMINVSVLAGSAAGLDDSTEGLTIETSSYIAAVRENAFLEPYLWQKRSIYQDRLGTHMRTVEKRGGFCRERT